MVHSPGGKRVGPLSPPSLPSTFVPYESIFPSMLEGGREEGGGNRPQGVRHVVDATMCVARGKLLKERADYHWKSQFSPRTTIGEMKFDISQQSSSI